MPGPLGSRAGYLRGTKVLYAGRDFGATVDLAAFDSQPEVLRRDAGAGRPMVPQEDLPVATWTLVPTFTPNLTFVPTPEPTLTAPPPTMTPPAPGACLPRAAHGPCPGLFCRNETFLLSLSLRTASEVLSGGIAVNRRRLAINRCRLAGNRQRLRIGWCTGQVHLCWSVAIVSRVLGSWSRGASALVQAFRSPAAARTVVARGRGSCDRRRRGAAATPPQPPPALVTRGPGGTGVGPAACHRRRRGWRWGGGRTEGRPSPPVVQAIVQHPGLWSPPWPLHRNPSPIGFVPFASPAAPVMGWEGVCCCGLPEVILVPHLPAHPIPGEARSQGLRTNNPHD